MQFLRYNHDEQGAEVSKAGQNGWTPLHSASTQTRKTAVDIVKTLLEAGANPISRTNSGKFPADVATNAAVKALLIPLQKQALLLETLTSEPEQTEQVDQVQC